MDIHKTLRIATRSAFSFFLLCTFASAFAAESISITATPRYPWNGKVDLKFTIDGTSGTKYDTSFTAKDVAGGTNLTMKTLTKSNGTAANVAKEQLLPGTYNWVWDATADLGEGTVLEKVVVEGKTEDFGGVQLWENGPYWAECNLGATRPEERGYYFWWGDTVGYKRNAQNNSWVSVKNGASFSFSKGNCPTCGKTIAQLKSMNYIDSSGNLVAKFDAAKAHLGAPWRLPTDAEFAALIQNCTTTWTTSNGVSGRIVRGKDDYATKSIFLPAVGGGLDSYFNDLGSVGFYWSSTPSQYSGDSDYSFDLRLNYKVFNRSNFGFRFQGWTVRPVRGVVK